MIGGIKLLKNYSKMMNSKFIFVLFYIIAYSNLFAQVHNEELKNIYILNDSFNKKIIINTKSIEKKQKQFQNTVLKLIKDGKVQTGQDYFHSAMILSNKDTNISKLTVELMKKAIELDSSINKKYYAIYVDRDLNRRCKPQIFGTIYDVMGNESSSYNLFNIDTTIISDELRKYYNVETLKERREEIIESKRLANLIDISSLLNQPYSIDDFLTFVKIEHSKGKSSLYNVSEEAINDMGYNSIKSTEIGEAYKLFLLNTKLYPESFNTWDSLGECLKLLGKKDEAISAYKKSIKLNPENENGKITLYELLTTSK